MGTTRSLNIDYTRVYEQFLWHVRLVAFFSLKIAGNDISITKVKKN